jgi:hypothetical protein
MSDTDRPGQIVYLKWGYPPLHLHADEKPISLSLSDRRDLDVTLVDGSIASIAQGAVAAVISPPVTPE